MARVFVLVLLLGSTFLQHTLANFGSTGAVLSSLSIKNLAESSAELFNKLDDKNGYVPQTDLELLHTVLSLITNLATETANRGALIGTAISAAVPSTAGNYASIFDPIQAAIVDLQNFIAGPQVETRDILTTMLGMDINNLFGDVFGNVDIALASLATAFANLQTGVSQATVAAGRARVENQIVHAAVNALSGLRATIASVQYIITTTIENVQMGDEFLFELEDISTFLEGDMESYLTEFSNSLSGILLEQSDLWNDMNFQWEHILSEAESVSMQLNLLQFISAFGSLTEVTAEVEIAFEGYLTTAESYLDQYTEVLVPRSYEAVNVVLEVLIAGGPNSRFCFFKFSPRLVNYYISLVFDVESCFNAEVERLSHLYDLTATLAVLIMYDVEDLISNLTVCNSSTEAVSCIEAIEPRYLELSAATADKIGFFLALSESEAVASVNRLGACIYTHKLKNVKQIFDQTAEILLCRENGPTVP